MKTQNAKKTQNRRNNEEGWRGKLAKVISSFGRAAAPPRRRMFVRREINYKLEYLTDSSRRPASVTRQRTTRFRQTGSVQRVQEHASRLNPFDSGKERNTNEQNRLSDRPQNNL